MSIRTLVALAALTVLLAPSALAQERPALSFSLADYAAAGDPSGRPSLTAFGFRARVPMPLGGRTRLVHEVAYRHVDFGLGAEARPAARRDDHTHDLLHSHAYTYRLTASHALPRGWAIAATAAPTLQSRMSHAPDGFALVWAGAATATRELGGGVRLGAGVAYSRLFGRPLVHPVVAFEWDNGGPFRADVYLPERAEAWWVPHERLSVGVTAQLDGDRFRAAGLDGFDGLDALGGADGHVRSVNATAGPAVRLDLARGLAVTAEGGATLHRSLRATGLSADVDLRPEATGYARLRLHVNLR